MPCCRWILLVHDHATNNRDIPTLNGFHPLNLSAAPFSLRTETIFRWDPNAAVPTGSYARPVNTKVVEMLTGREACHAKQRARRTKE
eukprot:4365491-Prymnesium_polylepis.2